MFFNHLERYFIVSNDESVGIGQAGDDEFPFADAAFTWRTGEKFLAGDAGACADSVAMPAG